MEKVFTNESLPLIGHLQNVLEHAGIAAVIRNDRLAGALGEIPYLETWPELWVVDPADADRATALIAETMADSPAESSWLCPECAEINEGQFGACWRCQTPAPG